MLIAGRTGKYPVMSCSVTKNLQIVPGNIDDYKQLACYHYRDGLCSKAAGPHFAIHRKMGAPAPTAAIFKLQIQYGCKITAGVIVYTFPLPSIYLRNLALGNLFTGIDRHTKLQLLNKNIRTISRVIIEPRFRGLSLAVKLVKETMPKMGVPIIEAMAVMGLVNPFFEKAGMKPYYAPTSARCVKLMEAFSMVGIEKQDLIDADKVAKKIEKLPAWQTQFIHQQMDLFLSGYRHRPAIGRLRYILTKLTDRPVYYIWLNKNLSLSV